MGIFWISSLGRSLLRRRRARAKPVLAHFGEDGGEGSDGDGAPWVAMDVPVQVFRVGRALIVSIPAEVSTHAGRRLARVARLAAAEASTGPVDDSEWEVIVNGLANGYAGYVTTREEYAAQMYEGREHALRTKHARRVRGRRRRARAPRRVGG